MENDPKSAIKFLEMSQRQHTEILAEIRALVELTNPMKQITDVGLKLLYLVPVSLAFLGVATWLFHEGKIDWWIWAPMNLVIMTPFFGERVKLALNFLNRDQLRGIIVFALILMAFAMAGCQTHDEGFTEGNVSLVETFDSEGGLQEVYFPRDGKITVNNGGESLSFVDEAGGRVTVGQSYSVSYR